jgi:hypothetical protein
MPQGRDYFRPRRLRRKARGAAPHISADSRSSPSLPDEGTDLGRGPCRKGWGQASTQRLVVRACNIGPRFACEKALDGLLLWPAVITGGRPRSCPRRP